MDVEVHTTNQNSVWWSVTMFVIALLIMGPYILIAIPFAAFFFMGADGWGKHRERRQVQKDEATGVAIAHRIERGMRVRDAANEELARRGIAAAPEAEKASGLPTTPDWFETEEQDQATAPSQ